jgi:hypothetical protein
MVSGNLFFLRLLSLWSFLLSLDSLFFFYIGFEVTIIGNFAIISTTSIVKRIEVKIDVLLTASSCRFMPFTLRFEFF